MPSGNAVALRHASETMLVAITIEKASRIKHSDSAVHAFQCISLEAAIQLAIQDTSQDDSTMGMIGFVESSNCLIVTPANAASVAA